MCNIVCACGTRGTWDYKLPVDVIVCVHSRPQRQRSFWSAPKIATSGWPLARSNIRSPWFTDFLSFCACSESSLTNLIGSGLNLFWLQSHSNLLRLVACTLIWRNFLAIFIAKFSSGYKYHACWYSNLFCARFSVTNPSVKWEGSPKSTMRPPSWKFQVS